MAKDHRDRFIGDRRRQNEKERLIHRACLPYAPRLKRILLKNGYPLRLNLQDVRDCFYLFQVDEERLKRQIIGPRVPEDWFKDPENESKDFLPISAIKPWLMCDLTDPPCKPSRSPGYVQVAIAGIMMWEKIAVAALQNAHRRQLLSCGALTVQSLLFPGTPFPREPVFGDVHVDDLAVLAIVETSNRAFAGDRLRMNRADTMYAALGMPIKKPAGDGDFEGPLWGAHLDGQRGKLGFPMCRRATLALTTCLGACLGVNRAQLKRLLGAWGHPLVPTGVSLLPRRQLRRRTEPPQPQAL